MVSAQLASAPAYQPHCATAYLWVVFTQFVDASWWLPSVVPVGVQAPLASWGSLAADGIQNIAIFPWQLIFPGVTMALTLFSLNFLGDGLRDALDPQMRTV